MGGTESLERRVSKTEKELLPSAAVTVADCGDLKTAAVAENVALEALAATVTDAGTDRAAVFVLVRATAAPPDGAD